MARPQTPKIKVEVSQGANPKTFDAFMDSSEILYDYDIDPATKERIGKVEPQPADLSTVTLSPTQIIIPGADQEMCVYPVRQQPWSASETHINNAYLVQATRIIERLDFLPVIAQGGTKTEEMQNEAVWTATALLAQTLLDNPDAFADIAGRNANNVRLEQVGPIRTMYFHAGSTQIQEPLMSIDNEAWEILSPCITNDDGIESGISSIGAGGGFYDQRWGSDNPFSGRFTRITRDSGEL